MEHLKQDVASDGRVRHHSVGALIQRGKSFLLFDRVRPPFGFAAPAGHIDAGEDPKDALLREVKEETGLTVLASELIFEEELLFDTCRHGVEVHMWYVYRIEVEGELHPDVVESQRMGWYTPGVNWPGVFDPGWTHWFKKLGIS
jgi:8-oxo-dGTP pyrophosphatase MutT (NUDIX family)